MNEFLRNLYAQIRPHISVARVVAALTPVFALAAGWLATKAAQLGYNPDPTQLTVIFGIGATAAVAAGLKWLDGRAKWEVANPELASTPPGPLLGAAAPDAPDEDFILSQQHGDVGEPETRPKRVSPSTDPNKPPDA